MCDMHEKAKISRMPLLKSLAEIVERRTIKAKSPVTSMRESHCSQCPFRGDSVFGDKDNSNVQKLLDDAGKSENWNYANWLRYLIGLVRDLNTPFSCHVHANQFCKGASMVQPLVNVSNLPIFNEEDK